VRTKLLQLQPRVFSSKAIKAVSIGISDSMDISVQPTVEILSQRIVMLLDRSLLGACGFADQ